MAVKMFLKHAGQVHATPAGADRESNREAGIDQGCKPKIDPRTSTF